MNETDPARINGYHAHVYFDADSIDDARSLCEEAARRFQVAMGRVHDKPVGPHPSWSCQLAFEPALFGTVVPWLALNRGQLVILVHPETGDPLRDHRDHALWMGQVLALNLSVFTPRRDEDAQRTS
jgi:aromatic ring-cleaving dioxygenase